MHETTYGDSLYQTFSCMMQNIEQGPGPPVKQIDGTMVAPPNHNLKSSAKATSFSMALIGLLVGNICMYALLSS